MTSMKKWLTAAAMILVCSATSVFAQEPGATEAAATGMKSWASLMGIGAGLVAIGAGIGIGMTANAAMHGMARQPEDSAKIQTAMLIAAALVEGVALFGVVICLIGVLQNA